MTSLRSLPAPLLHGLLLAALLAWNVGCSDNPTRPGDVPASHTQRRGSAWHAPGLRSPVDNCGACHARDLRGGANGEPSCYSCHGKTWN